MKSEKYNKLISLTVFFFFSPIFLFAFNEAQIVGPAIFELDTADTSVATTITADTGGQATNLEVYSNYIDITLDNASNITFHTVTTGQFLRITKQSGSNDYTVTPSCPTTSVTLIGTGATVILRLEVIVTNPCSVVVPLPSPPGGGGGGGSHDACPTIPGFQSSGPCTITSTPTPPTVTPTIITPSAPNIPVSNPSVPPPLVTNCSQYMSKYIKLGSNNDSAEVKKLQTFLRDYEGFINLPVTGIYDTVTYEAVKKFQMKYTEDILIPWGDTKPTGFVFQTTIKTINRIYCSYACSTYILKSIKLGSVNDPTEVRKLQSFLHDFEGFPTLPVTGVYDLVSYNAVKKFQAKYTEDVLLPWGNNIPTGYVFTTTMRKINYLYCQYTKKPTI